MANAMAGNANKRASILRGHRSSSARKQSKANSSSASLVESAPVTKGLFLVRSTLPSRLRSAMSLMTQPAERIRKTPATNMKMSNGSGRPCPAIQSAHSVGHNSNNVPMGRCRRIMCAQPASFCFML